MPALDIKANTKELNKATQDLDALLKQQVNSIKTVTSAVNTYNEAGRRTASVIKGLDEAGRQATARYKEVARDVKDASGKLVGTIRTFELASLSYKQEAQKAATAQKATTRTIQEEAQKRIDAYKREQAVRAQLASQGAGPNGGPPTPPKADDTAGFFERNLIRIKNQLAYFLTYRGFDFIASQLHNGVAEANKLQIQLSLIRTITQDSQQTFNKYLSDVRNVSDASGVDINKVAESFYTGASNQLAKGAGLAPIIQQVTDFARVTNSELTPSTNLLTSTINAFGLSTDKTEEILAKFFKTIDEGRVVTGELDSTFGRAAVLASNLGVSLEEVNATLAVTTQKGFTTSDAMTLITNLLIKLEKPTEATQALFKSLGVSSGEAAVRTLGFSGVLRKMIDLVKSGQVDVGAFFDEIRGRKQFGVFEQSIDQIDAFTNKLKNTGQVIKEYNAAKEIRGESPADFLNKEINKLANVFKVDLGSKILDISASFAKFVTGSKTVGEAFSLLGGVLPTVTASLIAYGVAATVISVKNRILASEFYKTGAAAQALKVQLIQFAAFAVPFAAAYEVASRVLDKFASKVNNEDFKQSLEFFSKLADRNQGQVAAETQVDKIAEGFKKLSGTIAEASKQNEAYVATTRSVGSRASENLKVAYEVYKKITDDNLQGIKSKITAINAETEKASKNALKYRDTLDKLLLDTKLKYANNDFGLQKVAVREEEIRRLREQADVGFRSGDPNKLEDARRAFDEIARLEKENFEDRQDQEIKVREARGETGTFFVNPLPLQEKLNALKAELADKERLAGVYLKQNLATLKQQEAVEEKRVKDLDNAFKKIAAVQVFNEQGEANKKFLKNGQIDRATAIADFEVAAQALRNAAGSPSDRIAIEEQIFNRRKALELELGAVTRQENLKSAEARALTAKTDYEQELKNNSARQKDLNQRFSDATTQLTKSPNTLRKFAEIFDQGEGLLGLDGAITKNVISKGIQGKIDAFQERIKKGDLKPEEISQQFNAILDVIVNGQKTLESLGLQKRDVKAGPKTVEAAKRDLADSVAEQRRSQIEGIVNATERAAIEAELKKSVLDPIGKLQTTFPSLSESADGAAKAIERLIEQLNKIIPNKVSSIDGIDAAYAADGGVAGLFPGQPRGVDRYPIWAAKDEYIVNANSSRLFRPLLDAINNRRSAAYMAGGGVVGGDTEIGDVTINVNGGQTNAETGQYLARSFRRLVRRGLL